MKKHIKKVGAIVIGLSVGVMSVLPAFAAGADWAPCPVCNSTTTVYEEGPRATTKSDPIACIHDYKYGHDIFVTCHELRTYSCNDCDAVWTETVEIGW